MWSKIWQKINTTVAGGAIIIAVASVTSRLLGLVRDRLLASTFGAGDVLDSYYAAFKIPDLIFNVLVLGALSAAFVPIFIQYLQKKHGDKQEAWHIANSLMNIILVVLVVFGAVFFIFAPQIMDLIAPGFDHAKQEVATKLARIMLFSIIFFGVSNIATGILNSFKRYINFAFAPVMYNLGIIFGILFLVPAYDVYGLAYGVVLGSIMHLLIQLPGLAKVGFRYKRVFNFKHQGVKSIIKLMLPRTLGLAVMQIDQLIAIIIGSTLVAGSVAVYNLANNLQSFPINVFGISLAIAAFPIFSEAFARKDNAKFVVQFSTSLRRTLFLIIPAAILILLLRAQIVRVILGSGAFDWEDTYLTAQVLGFFSLSLFAQSIIPLLARSFYALKDTKTPVKIAIFSVFLNIIGSILLSRVMGVTGLALSLSIASFVNMILLLITLRRRLGYLDDTKIIRSVMKILLISAIMGVIVWIARYVLSLGVNMQTFIGIFVQGLGAGLVGIFSYLIMAVIFRCDEIKILSEWLIKAKRQFLNGSNHSNKDE